MWNYGDILDRIHEVVPADRICLVHGDRRITWGEFNRRTNNLARYLLTAGADVGDKVAFYLRNSTEYSETVAACFKSRLVHVNVNYRYVGDELRYILDNSDSKIVVYSAEFRNRIEEIKSTSPHVVLWVEVTEGNSIVPEWARSYELLADSGDGSALDMQRSADDLLFLYTGGTTGMPKGVMWPAESHWKAMGGSVVGDTPEAVVSAHLESIKKIGEPNCYVPCCPMMHGTGLFPAISNLITGGTVVTLTGHSFSATELWQTVERHQVNSLAIVGDAFAKPMLQELNDNPGKYDISSLTSIISSGVIWSPEVKQGLLEHNSEMALTDAFGASEAAGFGRSVTTSDGTTERAKFVLGDNCKVFSESFEEIQPGSQESGYIAKSGAIPLGYYKDEEKTARTFPIINGIRYSMPGDICRIAADGSLILLGRGNACINTGGEKVYPEEVEGVLKTYPGIVDALVVGLPDEKWGQSVNALVEPETGANVEESALRDHVREHLAGYKVPKRIFANSKIARHNNGKPDYERASEFVLSQL